MKKAPFSKTIVFKLHQIIYSLDAQANEILTTQHGISYDEFMIINLISNYPEINQQGIAQTLRLGKSAISQRLRKLEQRNLLKRKMSKHSRRENILELTRKGNDLFDTASKILDEKSEVIFKQLKDKQLFDMELDAMIQFIREQYI